MYLISGFTTKLISGFVLVKYISEPIIYLYRVASIAFDVSSFRNFKFVVIGVAMALQCGIPNLFRISTYIFLGLGKSHMGSAKLQYLESSASFQGLSSQILQPSSSCIHR